jgi:DNA-binding HxlR family transcriptional regulator
VHGDAPSAVELPAAAGRPAPLFGAERRAPWTHRQWTPLAAGLAATGDRWTLLIVAALESGRVRLSRLRERLPGISTGVLDNHVRQMTELGLLSRRRFREMPPRVEVELTDAGRALLPIASALSRWGLRHMWSAPQSGQHVEVGVLLRMLPALLEEHDELPGGTIEAALVSAHERVGYVFASEQGRLRAVAASGAAVTGTLEGDEQAWIAALGPAHDHSGLRFKGRRQLANHVLAALSERA